MRDFNNAWQKQSSVCVVVLSERPSTRNALVNLVSSTNGPLDHGLYVCYLLCGLFLCLEKAFHIVNLKILIEKLVPYGIRGVCEKYFASYLEGRKQFLTIENASSETTDICCGVQQGSVLGPCSSSYNLWT